MTWSKNDRLETLRRPPVKKKAYARCVCWERRPAAIKRCSPVAVRVPLGDSPPPTDTKWPRPTTRNHCIHIDLCEVLTPAPDFFSRHGSLFSASIHGDALLTGLLADAFAFAPRPADSLAWQYSSAWRARALWAYNEDGREPNDLSFSAGETIEIIEETNPDWWTGKCRGKQGLFPSNYVEMLDTGRSVPPPPAPLMPMPTSSYNSAPPAPYGMPNEPEKAAMYQQSYASPPPGPMQPAPPVQVVQVQQEAPPKKNKFGKLGNTMATSAAGGVGFGAGAAIGSGLINAIF
ncbi:hypothetical protein NUW54_g9248 [Trametes sanguinea]|uniref:Uncharacterized protein n=1 Tax=Trametes sanguinea TaxID=158606 RepID=A0ACC1P7E8_9APHY|nr:hypothetical protein NUW54_g9248 [Trametes sanguinea]